MLLKGMLTFSLKLRSVTDNRSFSNTIFSFYSILSRKLSQCDDVASENDISTGRNWKFCVSSKKLVLCCSALTTAERVNKSTYIT